MFFTRRWMFFTSVWCLINSSKSEELGYCAPYNGKICKSYISGGQVWYPSTRSGGWENEEIATGLFAELVAELDPLCELPASKLLCAYAFPKCKIVNEKVNKLPLCYEGKEN